MSLAEVAWPPERLGEALDVLARQGGLDPRSQEPVAPPATVAADADALGRWLEATAAGLGIEAEPVESFYPEAGALLAAGAPALLRLPDGGFLALVAARRGRVRLLGPDHREHTRDLDQVRAALCRDLEAKAADVDLVLDQARVTGARRARARAAILRERLGHQRLGGCWLLRLSPGSSFFGQLRQAGLLRALRTLAVAHAAQYALLIGSWWVIGKGALAGHLDPGWLLAWALLLVAFVFFRQRTLRAEGLLAVGAGALLKRRLLFGALRLHPDEIRHQGIGQLLGRVIESDAVEALVLGGGGLGLEALIELALAPLLLVGGASGTLLAVLLLCWIALTVAVAWRQLRRRRAWTDARIELTHDLVERMVGQRTRVAQEARERWHDGVDHAVEHFLELSRRMDQSVGQLLAMAPRGWLVVALLGIAPAFVEGGAAAAPAALALSLGGILFAYRALRKLAVGLFQLSGAAIAWRQVAQLYHAAGRPDVVGSAALAAQPVAEGVPLIEAHDVTYRYRARGEPVLSGVRLRIAAGDRLLLEGPSGGGKSTLASLLIGMRAPESGLLLLGGLDHATLGSEGWRRRVISAPQFHENHVLAETLAFNLLMGRRWPPRRADIEEAQTICQELGLGGLLARMPAGINQTVGETGWQLSHGEKSRVFIARALLQHADLVILDESFAALDPETLGVALKCVVRRARTLLVIAHP